MRYNTAEVIYVDAETERYFFLSYRRSHEGKQKNMLAERLKENMCMKW